MTEPQDWMRRAAERILDVAKSYRDQIPPSIAQRAQEIAKLVAENVKNAVNTLIGVDLCANVIPDRYADLIAAALLAQDREATERCVGIVDEFKTYYAETLFRTPKAGEHGATVDQCSAAALRAILPNIADAIRAASQ